MDTRRRDNQFIARITVWKIRQTHGISHNLGCYLKQCQIRCERILKPGRQIFWQCQFAYLDLLPDFPKADRTQAKYFVGAPAATLGLQAGLFVVHLHPLAKHPCPTNTSFHRLPLDSHRIVNVWRKRMRTGASAQKSFELLGFWHNAGEWFTAFHYLHGLARLQPLGNSAKFVTKITDSRCFHGDTIVSQDVDVKHTHPPSDDGSLTSPLLKSTYSSVRSAA